MDPSMRRRLAALAAIAAVLLVLPAESAAAASLTLRASRGAITYTRAVTLTGTMPGEAGREVTLEESQTPFTTGFLAVRTATVAADGSFRFTLKPRRDTRYRMRAGALVSRSVPVVVNPLERLDLKTNSRTGAVRATLTLRTAPDDEFFAGQPVYFYFARQGERRFRRVGSAPLDPVRPGLLRARDRFVIARGGYAFGVRYCYAGSEGAAGGERKRCPRKGLNR